MKKKKYIVIPRNEKIMKTGLKTGRGTLDFKGKTMMYLNSSDLAREVDTEHGLKGSGEVWVEQDERLENHVNYHSDGASKSFFGPTRAFCEGWERIFGGRNGKETETGKRKTLQTVKG